VAVSVPAEQRDDDKDDQLAHRNSSVLRFEFTRVRRLAKPAAAGRLQRRVSRLHVLQRTKETHASAANDQKRFR
jgi:hypothetical protein